MTPDDTMVTVPAENAPDDIALMIVIYGEGDAFLFRGLGADSTATVLFSQNLVVLFYRNAIDSLEALRPRFLSVVVTRHLLAVL